MPQLEALCSGPNAEFEALHSRPLERRPDVATSLGAYAKAVEAPAKAGPLGLPVFAAKTKLHAKPPPTSRPAAVAVKAAPPGPYAPSRLTDGRINELNKSEKRAGHASHTQRYHRSADYRHGCEASGTPEWLQWADSTCAPEDGSDSGVTLCYHGK